MVFFWTGIRCKSPQTLNDVQVDLLRLVTINLRLAPNSRERLMDYKGMWY